MEFTYKSYIRLINKCNELGYKIASYHNADSFEKAIILRHDIDFSIDKAYEMAKIENQLGVSSTYFVLISSDFYNVLSYDITTKLKSIISLGHEIGLHFDEEKYKNESLESVLNKVYDECQILENAINTKVNTISMHRPSKLILESNLSFNGLINSYSSKYFKEYKYVSDSRMIWREDIDSILESKLHDKIHILTHPFWYEEELNNTKYKLEEFLNLSKAKTFRSLKANFRDVEEFINEDLI